MLVPNTGTWVDLIRVPSGILASASQHDELDAWPWKLLVKTNPIRMPDSAFADILLDNDGSVRQPDKRPLLRRLND